MGPHRVTPMPKHDIAFMPVQQQQQQQVHEHRIYALDFCLVFPLDPCHHAMLAFEHNAMTGSQRTRKAQVRAPTTWLPDSEVSDRKASTHFLSRSLQWAREEE